MRKRLDRVRKDCEWDEMQESRVNDGRSGDRRTKWEILVSRNKKRNTDAEISQKYNTIVQMISVKRQGTKRKTRNGPPKGSFTYPTVIPIYLQLVIFYFSCTTTGWTKKCPIAILLQ